MKKINYDYAIIGAGIYGLYAAKYLGEQGLHVALIEMDSEPLQRASYINQARVHNGYHYPRSVSTASKSAHYYERFNREFDFGIHSEFKKIYAISKYDSLTNAEQFLKFCMHVGIPADEINPQKFFNDGVIEAAYETVEYTYDAKKIKEKFVDLLKTYPNVDMYFNTQVKNVNSDVDNYIITITDQLTLQSPKVLNATYASINQVLNVFNLPPFKTKYELCEVILTKANKELNNIGITVMDGPFFSIMPFGLSGYHSLTSVSYTPHETANGQFPKFTCQDERVDCSEFSLQNCNSCSISPNTAWVRMKQQAQKYLSPKLQFEYEKSLFSVKTILNSSELDDSRPTVIKTSSSEPSFISVLSGKFNTIYDLEDVLL
ncbi:FAD-dependent oxidoreductase [Paenibacillus sp. 2TAB23]|uniref:FAD-dependent oxidoreductase n=1 Tax=Paenibacillus sp. 2TAB23 TaxID=3233004 RepID=UPI003F944FE2